MKDNDTLTVQTSALSKTKVHNSNEWIYITRGITKSSK